MACDVDNECSVFAIRALTNILQNRLELNLELSDEDCESIYQLVFHVHRPIAVAAAEFVNKKLFSQTQPNDAVGRYVEEFFILLVSKQSCFKVHESRKAQESKRAAFD